MGASATGFGGDLFRKAVLAHSHGVAARKYYGAQNDGKELKKLHELALAFQFTAGTRRGRSRTTRSSIRKPEKLYEVLFIMFYRELIDATTCSCAGTTRRRLIAWKRRNTGGIGGIPYGGGTRYSNNQASGSRVQFSRSAFFFFAHLWSSSRFTRASILIRELRARYSIVNHCP